MGANKNLKLMIEDDPDACFHCGGKARDLHHEPYVSQGNTAKRGTIPLCKKCHTDLHKAAGDFARWGREGGKRTASNPDNYKRNLVQYNRPSLKQFAAQHPGSIVIQD